MGTRCNPGLHVRRTLRELPLVPDLERHRPNRTIAGAFRLAAIEQPRLELVRRGRIAHRRLEQVALDRKPDAVRRGVAHPALATPLAGVEGTEESATEFRRRDH